jgi:hypothetical protein
MNRLFPWSWVFGMALVISCNKNPAAVAAEYKLSYGDSILYLRSSGNNIYFPTIPRQGTYSAFPEGIEIDQNTGAIKVDNSETGLRYRITHTDPDGKESSTMVVLSGINFLDKFYRLSQNDSIAFPIYDASTDRALPVTGSNFDEGNLANSSGCSVTTTNGKINLAASVRNGLFGNNPSDDDRRDIDIAYRLNDRSNKSLNKLKVRLYYYSSMATVAPDLLQTLQDREQNGVFLKNNNVNFSMGAARIAQVARPRPPCVIIIAN